MDYWSEEIKMVEKFKKYLVISYKRNESSNVYKRVINKISDDKYRVDTYYIFRRSDKRFDTKYIFNTKQFEELINQYLHEFDCEKTIYYK